MKDFLLNLGWVYSGMCGCSPPLQIYSHKEIKNKVIWIRPDGTVMRIRRGDVRDSKNIAIGGKDNYVEIYNHWINK